MAFVSFAHGMLAAIDASARSMNHKIADNKAKYGRGLYAHDGSHTVGQVISPVGAADFEASMRALQYCNFYFFHFILPFK